jgi:hypothetical protein
MKELGKEVSDTVEWSSPRLLCVAGDFTKYDVQTKNKETLSPGK